MLFELIFIGVLVMRTGRWGEYLDTKAGSKRIIGKVRYRICP
jgi:hypothetical protein